jgi:hypothetical protein
MAKHPVDAGLPKEPGPRRRKDLSTILFLCRDGCRKRAVSRGERPVFMVL